MVTLYRLYILLPQFGISLLFHVCSNCCFLNCIQISQESGQVVWYSHLFLNFPQFVVIHTVCGQESLRRNGVAITVNKRVWNAVLGCSLKKWKNDLCSFPRQTVQYHGNPSLCPDQKTEEAEVEQLYEDLQDHLELTPQKDVLLIIGDWNAKVGSQEISRVTGKFGLGVQNEAG